MLIFFIIIIALILVLGILFFMVKPSKSRTSDFWKTKLFAHRGISNEIAPENSIAAFKNAADNGYGIELDVRLTRDSVPVVFHDRTLLRLCGDKRKISEVTTKELENLSLLGTSEGIPLLSEVVSLFPNTPLICEIKTDSLHSNSVCYPVAQILRKRSAPTAVQSFNPFALRIIKRLSPDLLRGQLAGREKNPVAFLLRSQLLNFISRPDFVSHNINSRSSLFLHVCRKLFGLRLILWGAKESTDTNNADGVIFGE